MGGICKGLKIPKKNVVLVLRLDHGPLLGPPRALRRNFFTILFHSPRFQIFYQREHSIPPAMQACVLENELMTLWGSTVSIIDSSGLSPYPSAQWHVTLDNVLLKLHYTLDALGQSVTGVLPWVTQFLLCSFANVEVCLWKSFCVPFENNDIKFWKLIFSVLHCIFYF